MAKPTILHFIANARLKDVVGRDLINDDNVAIIELIKNAKDAGSKSVFLHFAKVPNSESPLSIIIQDFGRGMTEDDIKFKWLNIAYSEKKGSQPPGVVYAGNKGIGRFSCDRLGEELTLYSKARGESLLRLEIDWRKFEVDDQEADIGKIPTELSTIDDDQLKKETGLAKSRVGTILHVKRLRSDWNREKLLQLRRHLEKFVIDPNRTFEVELQVDTFKDDQELNGPIENKIFEKLTFRTTSIHSFIDLTGQTLTTTLIHDGDELFTLVEKNPYSKLQGAKISIFFLNQPAKAYFNRMTGYRSVDFGSMFLFLNGFRVMPYGQKSDDWLGLDKRKTQGVRRFLGTREVVGFIEITDGGDAFQAVSSREGLVNNEAFKQLTSANDDVVSSLDEAKVYGFYHKVHRKLERFVVEGLDWDRISTTVTDEDELIDKPNSYTFVTDKQRIMSCLESIISIRTPQEHVVDLSVNFRNVVQIAQNEVEAYEELVETLQGKFENTSVAQLTPAEKRNLAKFVERQSSAVAAKEESTQRLEQQLTVETKRRLFAEFEKSTDTEQILKMHHQTRLLAGQVFKQLDSVLSKYRKNGHLITTDYLVEAIEKALYVVDKIRKISEFASKASFNLATNRVTEDIVLFVEEYVERIQEISTYFNLRVEFKNGRNVEHICRFRPLEIMMLIDNVIDNAGKAGARTLSVIAESSSGGVAIRFVDDGSGLPSGFKNTDLFEKGITTTNGSGIGLYHVRQIAEELNAKVKIRNNTGAGATVVLEFGKT